MDKSGGLTTWVGVDLGLDPGARAEAEGIVLDWLRLNPGWTDPARLHTGLEGHLDATTLGRLLESLHAVGRLDRRPKWRFNGEEYFDYRLRGSGPTSAWLWLLLGAFVLAVLVGVIVASASNHPTGAAPLAASSPTPAARSASQAGTASQPTTAPVPSATANAPSQAATTQNSAPYAITLSDSSVCLWIEGAAFTVNGYRSIYGCPDGPTLGSPPTTVTHSLLGDPLRSANGRTYVYEATLLPPATDYVPHEGMVVWQGDNGYSYAVESQWVSSVSRLMIDDSRCSGASGADQSACLRNLYQTGG